MAEKKMCPHCGSQMFMVKITRAGLAEFTTDPNESCKILKESKDNFNVEIVGCARCKQTVTADDLVTGVKCIQCGRIVSPMDINTDGVCNVCEAVKQRSELANASKEDLIKMLLDAEKKANPVVAKMEKQIEKADNVNMTAPAPVIENAQDNDVEQPIEEDKKPKRKATRKKKDDDVSDVTENEAETITEESSVDTENVEATTEETEEAVDNIANQQEAPFPDIGINPPIEEVQPVEEMPVNNAVQEEQPIGADFRMFDDTEDSF